MRQLMNTLVRAHSRKRNFLLVSFSFFLFASYASAAATTISSAGIVGNLVYTGAPNTAVYWEVINTVSNNPSGFNAGGGSAGFDTNGEFSLNGLNMEQFIAPGFSPYLGDGTYTIYAFTDITDWRNCVFNIVCVNHLPNVTTFYRTAGVWSTSLDTDLTVNKLELGQVVIDPDINADGVVDLVAGKAAVLIATIGMSPANPGDDRAVTVRAKIGTQSFDQQVTLQSIGSQGKEVQFYFSPTTTGRMNIEVTVDPLGDIAEANKNNNKKTVSADVKVTHPLRIAYLRFGGCFPFGGCYGPLTELSDAVLKNNQFIQTTFPVSDTTYSGSLLSSTYLARVYRVTAKKACNVRSDQRFSAIRMYDLTGVNLEAL